DIDEFLEAVGRIASGGTVLDPQVVAQVMTARRRNDSVEGLTPREREALTLMAEGRSNAAIAGAMFVTEGAVAKHIQRIFGKLALEQDNSDNRRVLAVLAYLRS
ncbi:MAG: response regulator transcription factor, partial [Nakamurella sp.]